MEFETWDGTRLRLEQGKWGRKLPDEGEYRPGKTPEHYIRRGKSRFWRLEIGVSEEQAILTAASQGYLLAKNLEYI